MDKSKIIGIVVFVLFLGFVFWQVNKSDSINDEKVTKLNKEYPILSLPDFVDNMVIDVYYPAKWRGGEYLRYITLDDGRKYQVHMEKCITSKKIYLDSTVKKEAHLFKESSSDTLVVINNQQKYVFTIKADL